MANTKKYDWLVVGGGFKSCVAAYCFAKQGHSVLLLERSAALGGFLSPIQWGDFWIDKGPQFFDNFEAKDRIFLEDMVGPDIFEDIGFKYASFLNGTKTDDFAIPDWRSLGKAFSGNVFNDLLTKAIEHGQSNAVIETFEQLLQADGGSLLTPKLTDLTEKFLRQSPQDLSVHARKMTTFVGRKLLFDQDISVDLKTSPMLDNLLAAQKKSVGEERLNLYPKGSNLETVRAALEQAVRQVGVEVVTSCGDIDVDMAAHSCGYDGGTSSYDRAFFGCDAREAEQLLFGTDALLQKTHMLPEIFHCFCVPGDALDPAYYLVDYDPEHKSTRMTNFSNYMTAYDEDGYGVFCIEQAIDKGSAQWDAPETDKDVVFKEAQEAGNITCDTYKSAKSFRIPVTYKVPLTGFDDACVGLSERLHSSSGGSVIVPNPMSLTRKETLDDLRALGLLAA
ncbi:MAG: NAD(P)-binding protein [Pseudomonadota bacterium]